MHPRAHCGIDGGGGTREKRTWRGLQRRGHGQKIIAVQFGVRTVIFRGHRRLANVRRGDFALIIKDVRKACRLVP